MKFVDRTGEYRDTGDIEYSEVFCPIRYENAEHTLNAVCDFDCSWNIGAFDELHCALASIAQTIDKLNDIISDGVLDVFICGGIDTYEQN